MEFMIGDIALYLLSFLAGYVFHADQCGWL
jgi:hypothetical protein